MAALRERFGDAASAIAEREWRLSLRPRRLLPARLVRSAVACAQAAQTLLMAQSWLLLLEFSAVVGGWRFRQLMATLGLDPVALGVERRQWLDQQLQVCFGGDLPADVEAVNTRLRTLLLHGMH